MEFQGDPQPKAVCIGGGRVAVASVGSIYECGASAGSALNLPTLGPWPLALPPRFRSVTGSHRGAISIIPPFFADVLESVRSCGDGRQRLPSIGGGDNEDGYDKRSGLEVPVLLVGRRVIPSRPRYVAREAGKPSRTANLKAPASAVGALQCHHEMFHANLGRVCGHRHSRALRAISVLCMAVGRRQGGGGYAVEGSLGSNGGARARDGISRTRKQIGATQIPVDASQGVWMNGDDGDESGDEWDFLRSPYSFGQDGNSSGSSPSASPLPPPPALLSPSRGAAEPAQPVKLRKLKFGQLRKLKELPLRETVSPVRAVAAVRLIRVEDGGAFVDLMGGDGTGMEKKETETIIRTLGFRVNPLDERGQRQMTEIVAGVCRWKRYLDFLLECFHKGSARELERMEPLLRQIIRIGLFELVKLNEAPHVAVHQAVELAKFALRDGAGKKTNGILRAALRAKEIGRLPVPSAPSGDDEDTFASGLAIMHSHPTWLVKRWLKQFGEDETVKLLQWNNSRPTFGLRANAIKRMDRESMQMVLDGLGVQCQPSPYVDDFVRLQSGMQAILASPLLRGGFCAVQDESAGLMVALLDPKPGDVVVDCCAAPGGKALYAAARLKGKGKVIAIDVHVGRMRTLRKNAHTLGVGKWVETFVADAQRFAVQAAVTADKVLVDAPCSGVGVLSKRADLRWRRKVERLDEMLKLQDNLLDAAVRMLNPGGVIVYSTCSIEPQENEQRIAEFLRRHKNFVVESAADFVPADVVTPDGFVAVYPQRHGVDGAFGARLRKLKNQDRKTNDAAQQEKKMLTAKLS